jgi:hypothetical protein
VCACVCVQSVTNGFSSDDIGFLLFLTHHDELDRKSQGQEELNLACLTDDDVDVVGCKNELQRVLSQVLVQRQRDKTSVHAGPVAHKPFHRVAAANGHDIARWQSEKEGVREWESEKVGESGRVQERERKGVREREREWW